MARPELSQAKALLLAVQLTLKANISGLRILVSHYPLQTDILLRVLLSHLPESLEPTEYVPFLQDLIAGNIVEYTNSTVDASALDELSEDAARKRVRKLNLLPLAWPKAPIDEPADHIVQFLIHRSLLIDENTGLITQLPALLVPFLQHSPYLRTWMISTILPLLRLNYEYHPQDVANISIPKFEGLDYQTGIAFLLSRTGNPETTGDNEKAIGRDLRGLVGPWMYGATELKRRRFQHNSSLGAQSVMPLDEGPARPAIEKCAGWEEVFNWVTTQATTAWKTVVRAIEQWDGPGDVDLGTYGDGTEWLNEIDQQYLERRYAHAALACGYLISDDSMDALMGVRRILGRLHTLLDHDPLPILETAAALLSPVSGVEGLLTTKNAIFLRSHLLEDKNVLTSPAQASITFLHALLISAFLIRRAGVRMTIRRAGQLVLLQDEREQKFELEKLFLVGINKSGQVSDDKYWLRVRNELLWLRSWGVEELGAGGIGFLGKIQKESIEVAVLGGLLSNNRISLAQQIYGIAPDRPISQDVLHEALLSQAMNAYDNATNANKNRGSVKKCSDILKAFPETFEDSWKAEQLEHLIQVTHAIGQYRLVFKQGEPFTPVTLRVHSDPISIIGKILDQNRRSYTKINDFIGIGQGMVLAGLTIRNSKGATIEATDEHIKEHNAIAEKRIVSMCIDAALAADDFETAYSYIITRLIGIAGRAQERTPEHDRKGGLFAEAPPKVLDDWSWRAALQAGKYRRTSRTVKPTHLGNASGNPEIRHLEQRMECLSLAVRIAPKSTLQEILNVFRRCEEELESLSKREAEQEAAWDAQGDDQAMPGGFGAASRRKVANESSSRAAEEAPMSLFDLSRGVVGSAQSRFSSLSMLNKTRITQQQTDLGAENSGISALDSDAPRERKRDQLRNAAVGTVAAGVGWLIGAPSSSEEHYDH